MSVRVGLISTCTCSTHAQDKDGRIDCDDYVCRTGSTTKLRCSKTEAGEMACSDKKDNDGDKKIDCNDSGCAKTKFCAGHESGARE